DVNARTSTGGTPLMAAALYKGNAEVIRLLLKKGARPNADSGIEVRYDASALFFSVFAGDVETAGVLLDAGAKLDANIKLIGRFEVTSLMFLAPAGETALID